MPSKHSVAKTPMTFRIPGEVAEAFRAAARERDDPQTDVVVHLMREYAAGRVTLPPPGEQCQP